MINRTVTRLEMHVGADLLLSSHAVGYAGRETAVSTIVIAIVLIHVVRQVTSANVVCGDTNNIEIRTPQIRTDAVAAVRISKND